MRGTPRIKGRLTNWAAIGAAQILFNSEGAVAVAAVHGSLIKFVVWPHLGRVASHLVVALDAGVERVAALMLDSNNVALGEIVRALRAAINLRTADRNGSSCHQESKRSTCKTPFTFDRR